MTRIGWNGLAPLIGLLSVAGLASPAWSAASFTLARTQVCAAGSTPCFSSLGVPGDGPFSLGFNGQPAFSSLLRDEKVDHVVDFTGSAAMFTQRGMFATSASVSGQSLRTSTLGVGYTAGAFGEAFDILSIPTGSSMDLPIHLTGAVAISLTEFGSYVFPAGSKFGSATLSLKCFAIDVDATSGNACAEPERTFTFTDSAVIDTVLDFHVAFTAGKAFNLIFLPTLTVEMGLPPVPVADVEDGKNALLAGHVIADFSHTGVWGGAKVFDANGDLVRGAVIESASGFDYNAGFGAPPAGIPEPSTYLLFGIGAGGLGLLQRRRRRDRAPRSGWVRQAVA